MPRNDGRDATLPGNHADQVCGCSGRTLSRMIAALSRKAGGSLPLRSAVVTISPVLPANVAPLSGKPESMTPGTASGGQVAGTLKTSTLFFSSRRISQMPLTRRLTDCDVFQSLTPCLSKPKPVKIVVQTTGERIGGRDSSTP